jgi:putrescine---pyruvate transaminase
VSDSNFLIENNAKHFWHPMAHPAEMKAKPPKVITGAEGVEVTDVHGHRTLDAVGGLWNVNLGYSCDPIKEAITKQLTDLPYYSSFRGTSTGPAIELAYALREWFEPDGLTRSFFTSGGSDSVESALRFARQYHKIRGERDRTKFISVKKGYHGTHFGGASVNGNSNFRRNYEPLLPGCFHIPCPLPYRNPFGESDPARLAELCAAALDDEISFQGPDTVAAFIMEPVLGAGGVIPPHPTFFPMVREICDRHGVLLIADEVITAFGRTGAWTGSRLWDVKPDFMTTAKAITNGYYPFGAVMIAEQVVDTFESNEDSFGAVFHGYTYSAHPVGAAAALAALAETKRLNVPVNAAARGLELKVGCEALMAKYELVGDVRGQGLMVGIEMVSNRAAKTPAPRDSMGKLFEAIYEAGVMVRISGNVIILSPPLIITAADVARILAAIDIGLAAIS